MKLCELLPAAGGVLLQGDPRAEVRALCCDSRAVTPGALFVCLPGRHADGHDFAAAAVRAGAAGIVCEHPVPGLPPGVPAAQVPHARIALAQLACRLYGDPARRMTMVGVTGTKGKTTVAWLLAAMLAAAGRKAGVLGTNGAQWPGHRVPLPRTTPESCDLQALLRRMADDGCDACVMEVSSLGLQQHRVDGILFDIGIFTNLSPDHIGPGEHADFAEYLACKSELFRRCRVGVVNADDPHAAAVLARRTCRVVRYGVQDPAAWRALPGWQPRRAPGFLGVAFTAVGPAGQALRCRVGMPGRYSVYNALAALAAAGVLDLPHAAMQTGLQTCVVRGRTEVVPLDAPFTVVLDYAHNAAAAQSVLRALRACRPARLVALFGCGGGRSRVRRFGMGEACARLADACIVTEDNSRGEALDAIWADIRAGMRRGGPGTPCVLIADRRKALYYALDHARTGDIIAVLGKGHETTLQRGAEALPFDEREIIQTYMREKQA